MKSKQIKKALEIILRLYLVYVFASHGIKALQIPESWFSMFTAVGLSTDAARILLPLVGLTDLAVASLILLKPNKYIILWAAIWPSVPAISTFLTGESTLLHEVMHALPPLIVGLAVLFLRKHISSSKS